MVRARAPLPRGRRALGAGAPRAAVRLGLAVTIPRAKKQSKRRAVGQPRSIPRCALLRACRCARLWALPSRSSALPAHAMRGLLAAYVSLRGSQDVPMSLHLNY